METAAQPARTSNAMLWTGRVLSALPALLLIMSGGMKLAKIPAVIQGFAHAGLSNSLMVPIGILEISCAVVYLIPQTAVLGAILMCAYLGGATVTTLRVGDPWWPPVLAGVLVWVGLFLRDRRVRALLPLRSSAR
jgi:hypothetical protein